MEQQPSSADRLREHIQKELRERNLSLRWIENKYQVGHGKPANILRGKTTFRVDDLDFFAAVLGQSPDELFANAHGSTPQAEDPNAPPCHLADPQRLKQLIREAVDESLRRILSTAPFSRRPSRGRTREIL